MKKKLNLHLLWNTHTVKIDKYLESINILVYKSNFLLLISYKISLLQFRAFYLPNGRTFYKEKEKCEVNHMVREMYREIKKPYKCRALFNFLPLFYNFFRDWRLGFREYYSKTYKKS